MSSTEDVSTPIDSKTGSPLPSIPRSRPVRKAHTVETSLETSSEVDDNLSTKEDAAIEQEPMVPSHRPIRRSTTEDIDNLVDNTNEELEEMEKLIHKHSHHRTHGNATKEYHEFPHIPQRPRPKKKTSEEDAASSQPKVPQRPPRRSTSPLKTSTSTLDNEQNNSIDETKSPIIPPVVPQQRPLRRKTSSSPESSVPLTTGSSSSTETGSNSVPIVPKERPARAKQPVQDLQFSSLVEREDIKKGLIVPDDEEEKENTKAVNPSPLEEKTKADSEVLSPEKGQENVQELNSDTNKDDLTEDDSTIIEKLSNKIPEEIDVEKPQEINKTATAVSENQIGSSDVVEDMNETLSKDLDENNIKTPSKDNEDSEAVLSENNPEEPNALVQKIEEKNEEIDEILEAEKPSDVVQEDKKEEPSQQKEFLDSTTQSEAQEKEDTETKLSNDEPKSHETQQTTVTDSTKKDSAKSESEIPLTKQEPHIPASRPKKKGPPPVPKKPSSRIAAFQEMLQKQQMKDMENNGTNSSSGDEKQPPRKMNFINDLNNLIALPGMVPPGGMKPNNSAKTSVASESGATEVKMELPDVRQKRARGPRGRKLPSKVNSVTKVIAKNENYTVQVKPLWSLKIVPKKVGIENDEMDDTEQEEVTDRDESDPYDVNQKQEQGKGNLMSKDQHTDLSGISPNPVLKSTASLSDSIISRDEDSGVLMMEADLEAIAEKEMQEQFIEEDIKFQESLKQQESLRLDSEIDNSEPETHDQNLINTDAVEETVGEEPSAM